MSNITVVRYELQTAIRKAADQNYQRDRRLQLTDSQETDFDKISDFEREIYLEEAQYLLETTGENYLPDLPDTEHICLEQSA